MKTIMDILTPSNIQFMIFTGAKYSLLLAIGALFFGVILGIIGAALKLSKHCIKSNWKYLCRNLPWHTDAITDYVLILGSTYCCSVYYRTKIPG